MELGGKVADEITTVRRTARTASRPVYGGPQAAGYPHTLWPGVIPPQDGPNCRAIPRAAHTAVAAVERFGLLAGSLLAGPRAPGNPTPPPGEIPFRVNPREITRCDTTIRRGPPPRHCAVFSRRRCCVPRRAACARRADDFADRQSSFVRRLYREGRHLECLARNDEAQNYVPTAPE